MLQLLFTIARTAAGRLAAPCGLTEAERWRADPLSHPALRAMDQTQLADLPIGHPVLPKRLADSGC